MYVNGEQRICNNLGTAGKLTMAEGALGFGQVLYHSAAERQEFNASYWDRRGQRFYIENSPFIDERDWDNVGLRRARRLAERLRRERLLHAEQVMKRAILIAGLAACGNAATVGPDSGAPCDLDPAMGDTECAAVHAMALPATLPPARGNAKGDDPDAAALGFAMFFDARLSKGEAVRCATCHEPEKKFGDGQPTSTGLSRVTRNAPTILNAARMQPDVLGWSRRLGVVAAALRVREPARDGLHAPRARARRRASLLGQLHEGLRRAPAARRRDAISGARKAGRCNLGRHDRC